MADYSVLPDIVSRYQFCMSSLSHPGASHAVTGPFSLRLLLCEREMRLRWSLFQPCIGVYLCVSVCVYVCRGSDPHLTPPSITLAVRLVRLYSQLCPETDVSDLDLWRGTTQAAPRRARRRYYRSTHRNLFE